MKTFFGLLLGLTLLYSCSPQRRIDRLAYRHPDRFAKPCAALYPVKEKDSVSTVFVQGETTYLYDTISVDCDTVREYFNIPGSTKTVDRVVRIPVKVQSLRVDTFAKTIIKTVENTAKVVVLTRRLDETTNEAERLKKGRNTWRMAALIAGSLLLIGTALKLVKSKFV